MWLLRLQRSDRITELTKLGEGFFDGINKIYGIGEGQGGWGNFDGINGMDGMKGEDEAELILQRRSGWLRAITTYVAFGSLLVLESPLYLPDERFS